MSSGLNGEICGRCSAYVEAGNAFCTRCGSRLGSTPEIDPTQPGAATPGFGSSAPATAVAAAPATATESLVSALSPGDCSACGAHVATGSVFCGRCGTPVGGLEPVAVEIPEPTAQVETVAEAEPVAASDTGTADAIEWPPRLADDARPPSPPNPPPAAPRATPAHGPARPPARPSAKAIRRLRRVLLTAALLLIVLPILLAVAWWQSDKRLDRERDARSRDVTLLDGRVTALGVRIAALERENRSLRNSLTRQQQAAEGVARPATIRALRSVYTVETDAAAGTAWAAWTEAGSTYLITASHTVAAVGPGGTVTLEHGSASWPGTVVNADGTNDLALIRVDQPLRAIWQSVSVPAAAPGATIAIVGSPYGLEGTIAIAVVRRATGTRVQTDAPVAVNPANAGAPALDRAGRVIGVLTSAGGTPKVIPITRACVSLRRCG